MSAMGSPDATSSLALDAGALSALREQAKTAPGKALSAAATQFEAVFLQMMLKSMRDATPQDGPLDSSASKMYTSMFDQQIAVTMAKRGTGLSKVIETQLARSMPRGVAEAAKAGATPTGGAGAAAAAGALNSAGRIHAVDAGDGVKAIRATAAVTGARATPGMSAAAYSRNAATIPMTTKTNGAPPIAAPKAKAATTTSWLPDSIRAFVDKLRPAAEAVAKAVGLPVQYLLAQAGLESGWGKHQPKDASGAASHNILGIKAGRSWTGNIVASATHEVVGGKSVATQANFRSYDTYEASFRDFAKLLHGRRYAPALAQASDPAAYANALQKGGYATDPEYGAKLARAIRTVAPLVEAKVAAPAQVSARNADNPDVRT